MGRDGNVDSRERDTLFAPGQEAVHSLCPYFSTVFSLIVRPIPFDIHRIGYLTSSQNISPRRLVR